MLSQMTKLLVLRRLARWCAASPQPKTSMSRLSRAASMSPVIGVRLTQAIRVASCSRSSCAHASTDEGNLGERRSAPNVSDPDRARVGAVGECRRTDRAEPLRLHRPGILPRDLQQLVGLLAVTSLQSVAAEPRLRRRSRRPSPPVQPSRLGDQFAHRRVAARDSSSWNCGGVVPPRRRLARVGLSPCAMSTRSLRPVQARAGRPAAPGRS